MSSRNFNWTGARLLTTWPGSKRKEKDGLRPMISCKGTVPRTWKYFTKPAPFMFHQLLIIPSWRLSYQNIGLCEFKIHVAGLEGCFSGYEPKTAPADGPDPVPSTCKAAPNFLELQLPGNLTSMASEMYSHAHTCPTDTHNFKKLLDLYYVIEWSACTCICAPPKCLIPKKRALDPLEQQWREAVNHHMCAGTQTSVLCNKCS